MIFYFSGTGNSKFVAKELLQENEKLISMAEASREGSYEYVCSEGEAVGIVFPVYFYTVPSFVREFISKLEIEGCSYLYAVITCGGSTGQAPALLKKSLAERNKKLHYVESLVMPDNSMLFYQIPPVEDSHGIIAQAENKLSIIKADVDSRKEKEIKSSTWQTTVLGAAYSMSQGTKKFYATSDCISCGLCETNCPEEVIHLKDGKPSWDKEKCCKCSACINRCPVNSIQYGKNTIKRNRYVNPYENK